MYTMNLSRSVNHVHNTNYHYSTVPNKSENSFNQPLSKHTSTQVTTRHPFTLPSDDFEQQRSFNEISPEVPQRKSVTSRNVGTPFSIKRRNLEVSRILDDQFKTTPPTVTSSSSTKFPPIRIIDMDENNNLFRSKRNSSRKVSKSELLSLKAKQSSIFSEEDYKNAKADYNYDHQRQRVHDMKEQLMAGRYVSMTDIIRAKHHVLNAWRPNGINFMARSQRRYGSQAILKKLFCVKGIIKVPTPYSKPHQLHTNTFGTPIDLRMSFTNSDHPESSGRRRYIFDFTGFSDDQIELYQEGIRKLVIRGERPRKGRQRAKTRSVAVNLPVDLPIDNLRAVRDPFGTLIIEEAWKF